ncbi:MAG: N-succinylarginine dihydrolase [Parachlamydiaceae bacterium]|nr:N-succinylarginine dihydrolase [Parachlamydiaceae bacterium]
MKKNDSNLYDGKSFEINLDGIVGPTHNYSGLSYGNTASMQNASLISNPKAAAKEGLEKMRTLYELGIKQAIIPPQERPFIPLLNALGYTGDDASVLQKVQNENSSLLMACCSSASMWTANSATTSPSSDSLDNKVHFTPANLINKLHRCIESSTTSTILKRIFPSPDYFTHHSPLINQNEFSDEGAANHTRFCSDFRNPGVQLFVYGQDMRNPHQSLPKKFPPRQTRQACEAIRRLHKLSPNKVILAQQNPEAIDAGVFHNDVISVGNQNVFFYHERSFVDTPAVIEDIRLIVNKECGIPMHFIKVSEDQIPLQETVKTYLFNSQLVTLPNNKMALIAPLECFHSEKVNAFLKTMMNNPDHCVKKIIFQDIRQSMQNGGGPACLRLRVVLNEIEFAQMHSPVIFTEQLYDHLHLWIEKYYRDQLSIKDLSDPQLLIESRHALDELTKILQLGSIYSFQK